MAPRVTLSGIQRHRMLSALDSMEARAVWALSARELAATLSDQAGCYITPRVAEYARRAIVPRPEPVAEPEPVTAPAPRLSWWRHLLDALRSYPLS